MGSNEEIIQLLQKTQTIFKQTQRDKEEKYLNDIIQLQDKIKDLETLLCKMGRYNSDTLRDIQEMKDAFEQNDVYLDEIENQNDLLKDQLLKASLTADIKNLVITSCMELRNKDLHDEIERISKESNDVSFEVTQGLSKRIFELEKDLSKSEAKSIAFEIALQHKFKENKSFEKHAKRK
ncbi:hypothetical protein Tco_0446699 [Tanacetum coccineum]